MATGAPNESENELNRRFYFAIIEAQTQQARKGAEPLSVVVPEGRNPPVASDVERAVREHKIPDFYWAYIDHLAPDPQAAARQFVVECKRLTQPSKSWDYLAQYVEAGICRFVNESHGYGKDASSGAMVGYLQAIDIDLAIDEVSTRATASGIPGPTIRARSPDALIELHHHLDRTFRESPFSLIHLWASVTFGAKTTLADVATSPA